MLTARDKLIDAKLREIFHKQNGMVSGHRFRAGQELLSLMSYEDIKDCDKFQIVPIIPSPFTMTLDRSKPV